jgi:hypothetical protein
LVSTKSTLWYEAVWESEVGGKMIRGVVVAGYYCLNGEVSGLSLGTMPIKFNENVHISGIQYPFKA